MTTPSMILRMGGAGLLLASGLLGGCVSTPDVSSRNAARERRAAQDPEALARIGDAAARQNDMKTAAAFYGRAAALKPEDMRFILSYPMPRHWLRLAGRMRQSLLSGRLCRMWLRAGKCASLSFWRVS